MNQQVLDLIDELVREKGVEKEDVIAALEQSLVEVAKMRYGNCDLFIKIDPETSDIKLKHSYIVSENPVKVNEISVEEAKLINKEAQPGDKVEKNLPFDDFSRIGERLATNELFKNLEKIRRQREFDEFSEKVGEIINGFVKHSYPNGDILVSLGKGFGLLPAKELLPQEREGKAYRPGEAIRAYIKDVVKNVDDIKGNSSQIILSRTHNQFLNKLFALEVPEIHSGVIEIKAIARDPGRRAKIAVHTYDNTIDPVGSCIGPKGSRIEPITSELKGEKIDVVAWSEDNVQSVINSLKPAQALKAIQIHNNISVIVADDQKSKVVGQQGQNIKLATLLTGIEINVYTETEEKEKYVEMQRFLELSLDIDEEMAKILLDNGFETIKDINMASAEELGEVEGFDVELAQALKERTGVYFNNIKEFLDEHKDIDLQITRVPGFRHLYLKPLYENNIKTVKDLSEITSDKLMEILADYKISALTANKIINYIKNRMNRPQQSRGNRFQPTRHNSDAAKMFGRNSRNAIAYGNSEKYRKNRR